MKLDPNLRYDLWAVNDAGQCTHLQVSNISARMAAASIEHWHDATHKLVATPVSSDPDLYRE